ncbi:class I SAM-dependent methyltransferase [Halalkalirubrum salinum]|uniref:class I SAM-dependent methyltransferase n=1 Tax=Halalkalirubrum salinum TaxID=2563889 RepID=UPI0010FBBA51|nr:class I SAM-dependent methyltransferase [Halalkalirubrum salinum]
MGNSVEPDAFGRAVYDHYRGEQAGPLWQCDGPDRREHPIEAFYFEPYDPKSHCGSWIDSQLSGPLIDIGAGAGRDTLYFQEQFETVAIDASPALVQTMDDRGVEDARVGDMFGLRSEFDRDRFAAALVYGTQLGLAGSIAGIRSFLCDLAYVTEPGATAVVDGYDPTAIESGDRLGYRRDPTPGLAHRVMWFEYDGEVDPVLQFRLFSPGRLREAAIGTGWELADVTRREPGAAHYLAALRLR